MPETPIVGAPLGSDSSGTITTQNLAPTGTATTNSAVTLHSGGRDTLIIQITGTYTGALSIQGTLDGTNWVTLGGAALIVNLATSATAATIASAATGLYQTGISGLATIRVTALAAVTGTATLTLRATDGNAQVAIDAAIPAGSNSIGSVTVASGAIVNTPTTPSAYNAVATASTNAAVIKASAGTLHELTITNTTAAIIWIKLYNKATAPTVGTDVPVYAFSVPANSDKAIEFGAGKRFATGIAIATTGGQASNDVAAIGAGPLISGTHL